MALIAEPCHWYVMPTTCDTQQLHALQSMQYRLMVLPVQGVVPAEVGGQVDNSAWATAQWQPWATRQWQPLQISKAEVSGLNDFGIHADEFAQPNDVAPLEADVLVEELLQLLRETSPTEQWRVVDTFRTWTFRDQSSCRAAQSVLEQVSVAQAALLASSLKGHVRRAARSKFANFVLQRVIEILPTDQCIFVVEELLGYADTTARNQHGCRILCRLLEHLAPGCQSAALSEELLLKARELCSHMYGTHVIRHLLEYGSPQQKQKLAATAILPCIHKHAGHKLGSHVVEQALRHCSQEDQLEIAGALTRDKKQFMVVANSNFGIHVVKLMLTMSPDVKQMTTDTVKSLEPELRRTKNGKDILQALTVCHESTLA